MTLTVYWKVTFFGALSWNGTLRCKKIRMKKYPRLIRKGNVKEGNVRFDRDIFATK